MTNHLPRGILIAFVSIFFWELPMNCAQAEAAKAGDFIFMAVGDAPAVFYIDNLEFEAQP